MTEIYLLDRCCCHAKTFNVAHYSKSIRGINTKLYVLSLLDKMQLQDKRHNS